MKNKILDVVYKTRKSLRVQLAKKHEIYQNVIQQEATNLLIKTNLDLESPLSISRLGYIEAECLDFFLKRRPSHEYGKHLTNMIDIGGFFPDDGKLLDRFCQLQLDSTKLIDILGVWYVKGEANIIQNFCPTAHLVPLKFLEPYYHKDPWSYQLKEKRVLVVHPCPESIQQNFLNIRSKLFKDPQVLPDFHLQVMKSVNTILGLGYKTGFNNWFEAFDYMCDEISKREFDVAILGCGSYALPLAAFVKSLGKKAIHLGGATQLLFGIRGKRWDERPFYQSLFNEFWTRPLLSERPEGYQNIEGGAYW